MTTIADSALLMRASIVGEMITGFGVVMLGSLMFIVLKKQNRNIALVALELYLVEVAMLGVREVLVFSLLRVSQESVMAGHPANLQTLGTLFYESQSFAYTLHTLLFAAGATLFYSLGTKPNRVELEIMDALGETVRELETERTPGLHKVRWNLRRGGDSPRRRRGPRMPPGTYRVVLTVDNQTVSRHLVVQGDPDHPDGQPWGEEYDELLEQIRPLEEHGSDDPDQRSRRVW